ncbi:MAG: hypothetical protein JSR41_07525 [Proteobacteria bacterium]|nr:hypothetical protein [Pseudomonadota bacterium]
MAQTHVIKPEGSTYRSRVDVANKTSKRLRLIGDRAALLMVEPRGGSGTVQVRAQRADGQALGPLLLDPPERLPRTDSQYAAYSTVKHSILLPKEWIQPGTKLQVSRSGAAGSVDVPLSVGPSVDVTLWTWPFFYYGAKASASPRSIAIEASSKGNSGITWDRSYVQRMPFSRLLPHTMGPIEMAVGIAPPVNDANFCHPAFAYSSESQLSQSGHDGFFTMGQTLLWATAVGKQYTGNNDRDLAAAYWMPLEQSAGNGKQSAEWGGGLGGSRRGTGDQDEYGATFLHELGHGFSLSHAATEYDAGTYPYFQGGLQGSAWGYDADRNQLLSTVMPTSKYAEGRLDSATGVRYKKDPMAGGQLNGDNSYKWGMFADYNVARMQAYIESLPQYDANFKRTHPDRMDHVKVWNEAKGAFESVAGVSIIGLLRDVMKVAQPVTTIAGTLSHFNVSPQSSRIFVGKPGVGNMPRLFDPTRQEDMDQLKAGYVLSASNSYCSEQGCDYTMAVQYESGAIQRVLLPVGHRNSDGTLTQAASDPLSANSFVRYVVNLPGSAGTVVKVQVFHTPLGSRPSYKAISASELGGVAYPLMNEWVLADGASGGKGGAGPGAAPNFDACNPKAKRYMGGGG